MSYLWSEYEEIVSDEVLRNSDFNCNKPFKLHKPTE